jgi:hypothetical protein
MTTTSFTSPPTNDQTALETLSNETLKRLDICCGICLDELSLETPCLDGTCLDRACNHVVQTKCKHIFHHQCISTWLDVRDLHFDGTCPYCRAVLINAKPPRFQWPAVAIQILEFVAPCPNQTDIRRWIDRATGMAREIFIEFQDSMREQVEQGTWATNEW